MNNANGGNILFHFKGDASDLKKTTNSIGSMTKSLLAATGITKLISTGFNMIASSTDAAIARFDTLQNFPKVMSNLGISSSEAEKSIAKMSEKLMGLPTRLDQGAMAVQRFASANGDVARSTDLFLAVNNAILAGGASAEIQSSALEQLSQAYAKGKPDMMEWRTLMTAMPAQLKQIATAMGYVDASALGEALREGSVSMDEFMDTIVRLNTEGLEGFSNFETQARAATGGISTALTNMKSRIATGVAGLIEAVNKGLEENGFGTIASNLEQLGTTIKDGLIALSPYIIDIISWLSTALPNIIEWIQYMAPFLAPIIAGFVAFRAVLATMSIIKTITTAFMLFNAVLVANPIALIIALIAALVVGIIMLWNKCEWFRNLVSGVFEFFIERGKSILSFFSGLITGFTSIGRQIVEGIANGITNGIEFIKGVIRGFVGNVTGFIKKLFKIGSPSKLMANEIGKFIPEGIAVGIDANADSVKNSMKDLEKSSLSAFQLNPELANSLHYTPNVVVNNQITANTDPLGQTVAKIKTFSNGAKNDYNYGMGV